MGDLLHSLHLTIMAWMNAEILRTWTRQILKRLICYNNYYHYFSRLLQYTQKQQHRKYDHFFETIVNCGPKIHV